MNEKIRELAAQAEEYVEFPMPHEVYHMGDNVFRRHKTFDREKFAELIVQHCIGVCEEMAAQCGGLPGDGALARDCAHWIRKDFGVAE